MEFRLGSEQRVCSQGDVVVIPGGIEHEAWFGEDTEDGNDRLGRIPKIEGGVRIDGGGCLKRRGVRKSRGGIRIDGGEGA
jgi:hypothetical protein